jgi:hypothetical protein
VDEWDAKFVNRLFPALLLIRSTFRVRYHVWLGIPYVCFLNDVERLSVPFNKDARVFTCRPLGSWSFQSLDGQLIRLLQSIDRVCLYRENSEETVKGKYAAVNIHSR